MTKTLKILVSFLLLLPIFGAKVVYKGIDGSEQTCEPCWCDTDAQGNCIVVDNDCNYVGMCSNLPGGCTASMMIQSQHPWNTSQLPIGRSKNRSVDYVEVAFSIDSSTILPSEPIPGMGAIKSTWFFFIAPPEGTVSISTSGSNLDTKMAIWSTQDVRNYNTYTKVAENDDFGKEFTSFIQDLKITPDKTYYVQVYVKNGATGNGIITLKTSLPYEPISDSHPYPNGE